MDEVSKQIRAAEAKLANLTTVTGKPSAFAEAPGKHIKLEAIEER